MSKDERVCVTENSLQQGLANKLPVLQLFSFVLPVFNEFDGMQRLRQVLTRWMDDHTGFQTEIILVDDGSTDAGLIFMRFWASMDARVRVLVLSRNFGHQAAITAGLENARGDAVVVMDADLQQPLTAVDRMIEKYLAGYDVVYGVKKSRHGDALGKRLASCAYYRLQRRLLTQEMPMEANDFRLVSRACLDAINPLPEKSRYVRGLFAWIGFSQIGVPYFQEQRHHGRSKFSFSHMLVLAWTGVTAFSVMPIRFVTLLGFVAAVLSLSMFGYVLYDYVLGNTAQGWATVVSLQLLMGGCILLGIGVVGEYVGKIYEEVKARPIYILREEISRGRRRTSGS